jgi:hypothetical protein
MAVAVRKTRWHGEYLHSLETTDVTLHHSFLIIDISLNDILISNSILTSDILSLSDGVPYNFMYNLLRKVISKTSKLFAEGIMITCWGNYSERIHFKYRLHDVLYYSVFLASVYKSRMGYHWRIHILGGQM